MYFTLLCFGFGLVRAVKVSVSHRSAPVARIASAPVLVAGIMLAVGLGVMTMVSGWLLSGSIYRSARACGPRNSRRPTSDARGLGAPLALAAVALRERRYGAGDATTPCAR